MVMSQHFLRHVDHVSMTLLLCSLAQDSRISLFLSETGRPLLRRWLGEASAAEDIEGLCLCHAFLTLTWTNVKEDEIEEEEVLGSMCFLRTWHGFGMG